MLGKSKTKNNFGLFSTLKDKRYQYISRSTNKKVSKDNINNKKNNKIKDNFKVSSTLMDINRFQNSNSNGEFKKYIPEFSQNNNLYNLITKNQNSNLNKNNINVVSMPKNKLFFGENNSNNSSLFFNMNEEMKINNIIYLNNQKNKNIYSNNIGLENMNNLNIQKYNIKKNYEKYINSNNNSIEEKNSKNKNNFLILEPNINNKYMASHKTKNIANNNKFIIQKILTNLFTSNKKPNNNTNLKKKTTFNNKDRDNKFINDSFNNNKISNYNSKNFNNNYFNKEKKNTEKNRATPRLKSNNNYNHKKKISGLFSANPKEKSSKLVTDINNNNPKKTDENLTKRNLSINIHSYNVNDYKFKTSIELEANNKIDIKSKNVPKLNLNQLFNLKLYDKTKVGNNDINNKYKNYSCINNISIDDKNQEKRGTTNNINIISNSKNKLVYNKNDKKNTSNNKSNTYLINTKIEDKNNNNKDKKQTKFSPKNIYIKGLRKTNIQRFFSYSKDKTSLNNNIHFMNNIKKINFNDTKKSPSKNNKGRLMKSNEGYKNNNYNSTNSKVKEIKYINKKIINNNKHNNISNSATKFKSGENMHDSHINLRKRKPKYSDINRIIEINNLKCMKYINNSEINHLKKININFSTNEANEYKNNLNKNNHKRNNHSASHNNVTNNEGKYAISKIGSIFKPVIDNNIRSSFNENKNKTKNKINYNFLSFVDSKSKEKNSHEKNIIHKNKFSGKYESNKKVTKYNKKIDLEQEKKINLEIEENKTKENILKNSLTMYSIYIISKYYNTCNKIGILKITVYDKDKNIIPIEYSTTNNGTNINYLFSNNNEFSLRANIFNDLGNIPLIADFEQNFCINFYIKNIYISNIEYIYINNYSDVNNGISPIKEITIYQKDILLYKGYLELNNQSMINISNIQKRKELIKNFETNEQYRLLNYKKKSLTYTIFKSLINDIAEINENNNSKLSRYNSARNTFHENYINSSENNIQDFNENKNTNNILDNKSKSFIHNVDFNLKENENQENNLFFKTNQDNNLNNNNNNISLFSNTYKDLSNTNISNLNFHASEIIDNSNDINFSKTLKYPSTSKLFLNSYNSASDDCDNLFKTSIGYKNLPEYNSYSLPNIDSQKDYIELNKISIYLKSNFGHRKYVGLTGIIFLDENNEQIDIEKAEAIGALPKDLRTIYNDDSDNRIFENVFNGINNTNDADNMWVTRIKKNEIPYFELFFEEKIRLKKILIYNYNQIDRLDIGAKEIDIYIDNYFFKKINLIQGTGEIAYNSKNNKNCIHNDDFSQEILLNNVINESKEQNLNFNEIIKKEINYEDLGEIKYASNLYEQNYETPYLPCCNIIKIQLLSYYNDKNIRNNDSMNEFFIGFDEIQIFNQEGINILKDNKNEIKEKNKNYKYKIVSNRDINSSENISYSNNKIFLKGIYEKDENQNIFFNNENYLFYVFEKIVQIGYIIFYPIDHQNKDEQINYFKTKEIKIFSDDRIIYEGTLYNNKPTIILFTCDDKIIKDINKDYLTKNFNERKVEEIETNNYNSLILN